MQGAPEKGEEVVEEVKRLREENLYLRAELENLRRILDREVEEARRRGAEKMALGLISMFEEIERVYNNAREADLETTLAGLSILVKELKQMLTDHGIKVMDVIGRRFDPFIHEAAGYVERDDVDDEIIIAEISRGYEFRGRVVKVPRVIVAKMASKKGEEEKRN